MMTRPWTAAEIELAIGCFRDGATPEQVGERCGRSKRAVLIAVARLGFRVRDLRQPALEQAQREAVAELVQSPADAAAIAERAGVNVRTLYKWAAGVRVDKYAARRFYDAHAAAWTEARTRGEEYRAIAEAHAVPVSSVYATVRRYAHAHKIAVPERGRAAS